MADKDPNATRKVQISNTASGPRYVHTADGVVAIRPGQTSPEVTVRVAELDALPAGLTVGELSAEQQDELQGNGNETGGARSWPADLAADTSDGLILRNDLVRIAKGEGVEFESDANKSDIANAIVAKRMEGAGVTDGPTS